MVTSIAGAAAQQQAASSTSKSDAALKGLTGNFNTFLKFLTTQLQNQDPLTPMDTDKFTEQMTQFANVEQSIATNKKLEELVSLQKNSEKIFSLSLLGSEVEFESNEADYSGSPVSFGYTLPKDAESTNFIILNEKNIPVASFKGEPLKAGSYEFEWNGLNNNNIKLPHGKYTLKAEALDANGKSINVEMTLKDTVNGIETHNGLTKAIIGKKVVELSKIRSIDAKQYQYSRPEEELNNLNSEEKQANPNNL